MEAIGSNDWLFTKSGCLTPRAIDAYVKHELPSYLRRELEIHIQSCDFCRDAVEGYVFNESHVVDFDQLIDEAVRNKKTEAVTKSHWKQLHPLIAMAAVIVLFVGIYLIHKYRSIADTEQTFLASEFVPAPKDELKENPLAKPSESITPKPVAQAKDTSVKRNIFSIPVTAEEPKVVAGIIHNIDDLSNNFDLPAVNNDTMILIENTEQEDHTAVFTVVEEMPVYPGGEEARLRFFKNNIVYPSAAKEANVQGIVYIGFIITKDGIVKNPKVLRSLSKECDEEALRVVKMMPPWNPGKQAGKTVDVQYTLPIRFNL